MSRISPNRFRRCEWLRLFFQTLAFRPGRFRLRVLVVHCRNANRSTASLGADALPADLCSVFEPCTDRSLAGSGRSRAYGSNPPSSSASPRARPGNPSGVVSRAVGTFSAACAGKRLRCASRPGRCRVRRCNTSVRHRQRRPAPGRSNDRSSNRAFDRHPKLNGRGCRVVMLTKLSSSRHRDPRSSFLSIRRFSRMPRRRPRSERTSVVHRSRKLCAGVAAPSFGSCWICTCTATMSARSVL